MCQDEPARALQWVRGMTRLSVVLALGVLLLLCAAAPSSAAAQSDAGWTSPHLASPLDAEEAASATTQHRLGSALVAVGLTANLVGGGLSFWSVMSSMTMGYDGGCFDTCAPRTDWGAIVAASLTTASVGLVMFFVGLGLDIHAHVVRDASAPRVGLGAGGLTVTF